MQDNALLDMAINDLHHLKATQVCSLDVRPLTSVTDFMVIATGNSSRHVNAIAQHLIKEMKHRHIHPLGIEGDKENEWILIDLGDLVVHIMQQRVRDFYQLEKLWSSHHHPAALPMLS